MAIVGRTVGVALEILATAVDCVDDTDIDGETIEVVLVGWTIVVSDAVLLLEQAAKINMLTTHRAA